MSFYELPADFDAWKTGHWGEDQYHDEDEWTDDREGWDPSDDEPDLEAWREKHEREDK